MSKNVNITFNFFKISNCVKIDNIYKNNVKYFSVHTFEEKILKFKNSTVRYVNISLSIQSTTSYQFCYEFKFI